MDCKPKTGGHEMKGDGLGWTIWSDFERSENYRESDKYKRALVEVVTFIKKPRKENLTVGAIARHFRENDYIYSRIREILNDAKANGEITRRYRTGDIDTEGKPIKPVGRNKRKGNHHPTVKPIELMRYLVRLITPPGGTVLDPFMGSGSTGLGAIAEDCQFIGIEQDADYLKIAEERLKFATRQARLF
jgi:DNA modification methylase